MGSSGDALDAEERKKERGRIGKRERRRRERRKREGGRRKGERRVTSVGAGSCENSEQFGGWGNMSAVLKKSENKERRGTKR